jgi:mannosyltransferase OCH1-like enzyme
MNKTAKTMIPRIIHQIWSGVDEPLPEHFKILGNTWKEHYPAWQYEYWDNERMNRFIQDYYPQYGAVYNQFPYNVQRWDAIRYLILDRIGGMYVDFDYESLEPMDELIRNKTCCFAMDPPSYWEYHKKPMMFNNALMLSIPGHPFMKKIIDSVFSVGIPTKKFSSKFECVLNTTGPWLLIDLYESLSEDEKKEIYLIPSQHVTPFNHWQARRAMQGEESDELEDCLTEAYAVHYFFNAWQYNNE